MTTPREIIVIGQHDHGETFPSPEQVADHILNRLSAGGYRILGPDDLDPVTLEQAADAIMCGCTEGRFCPSPQKCARNAIRALTRTGERDG